MKKITDMLIKILSIVGAALGAIIVIVILYLLFFKVLIPVGIWFWVIKMKIAFGFILILAVIGFLSSIYFVMFGGD